ncbi:MAG: PIN domain-containing protein [Gammaproteobacteria bacterium]|nr:PIN domain-containing protein [Gammaproteobacteria bacterium]
MRALLDVNVLIALLDADHVQHAAASRWLSGNLAHGWASCPITQNGCVRIMSQPGYPNALPAAEVAARLAEAAATPHHEFWADRVSLLDDHVIDRRYLLGPRQVTAAYLLALAVRENGRFVTFDRSVSLAAARGAAARHLCVL